MCAPAAAALFLAALAALPCKGTDADTSTIRNENSEKNPQPMLNKVYQMLHTSTELHNETKLSFNASPVLHSFETNIEKSRLTCCQNDTHSFSSDDGATDNQTDEDKRIRNPRLVNEMPVENVTLLHNPTAGTSIASPVVMERKRKSGVSGSSAPLLNYIFDTYSNTHYHRNEKTSNGNSIYVAAGPEIEALVGSTAHMDCKVDALHDKLVSWVRRKNDEEPMELLTTGTQQYTADNRYSARFIPPDIWRLEIKEVRPTDAAFYDCQLSAHPPRTARVTLRVPEVSIQIVDGAGAPVSEQVCELGSTVALRCEVRGLRMEGGPSLLWYRKDDLLNDDTTRGGISVRTEFGPNGASSVLRVARVRGDDGGQYSCSIARTPPPPPAPAHVILHIIKGESLAELHQGVGRQAISRYLVIGIVAQLLLQ
ncbi:uncharacterized protein LOC116767751 [Danaus plexippus]|uniref:Obscurin n=1 Tax=Danaus plexippus plexippus TaxID=278856 RepID=A0A212F8H3_DANPL|nr:uncharacterized protein LOC116767751 [Danaus plexippus]OWR50046.1 Obscurin [Danaus plexippus plexippus]